MAKGIGPKKAAKSIAERQKDLRQRRRASGGVAFSCFFSTVQHQEFKNAATVEEETLEQWIKKTLSRRIMELKKVNRLRS